MAKKESHCKPGTTQKFADGSGCYCATGTKRGWKRLPVSRCKGKGKASKASKTPRGRRGRARATLTCYGSKPSTRKYSRAVLKGGRGVKCTLSEMHKIPKHTRCNPGGAKRGSIACKGTRVTIKAYARCIPRPGKPRAGSTKRVPQTCAGRKKR